LGTTGVEGWEGVAYNPATQSENRIHADDVARRFGFRGGLVPGVTVHAYLVQPAVVAWGLPWLERGLASVVLRRPLYAGARFRVAPRAAGPHAYDGEVIDAEGVVCASGRVELPDAPGAAPSRRGDRPAPAPEERADASRAVLEALRERGLGAFCWHWNGRGELARSSRELDAMPDLVRPDRGGYANPSLVLGLANWALSHNVRLGPWIHVQSDVRHFAAVPTDTRLVVEAAVEDLFERAGNEFVDLDVRVFAGDRPVAAIRHRAIYVLRPR
jgi:hypothetical protein